MTSIKLKIKNVNADLEPYFLEYNKLKRIAYNYIKDNTGCKCVDVVIYISHFKKILDRSFLGWIVADATQIYNSAKANNNTKIIFGGKSNFLKVSAGKISKAEWVKLRNPYIYCIGSKSDTGNRKIKIDLKNKVLFFKPIHKNKITINFENVSVAQYKILDDIINLAGRKGCPITYKIYRTFVIVNFDECKISELKYIPVNNRILSIDSNPNFIGLSINDFSNDNVQVKIFSKIYDLRDINKNRDSNKRKYELCDISKNIIDLCIYYKVQILAIEKLLFAARGIKKDKKFNKLVNNIWNRRMFFFNLEKRCNLLSIKIVKICPEYSSFIGCLRNLGETDSVAASLEIARRANFYYKTFVSKILPKNTKVIFPEFNISLIDRWKEDLGSTYIKNWVDAYNWFKNKKPKPNYRFLYDDYIKNNSFKVFSFNSAKSNISFCQN